MACTLTLTILRISSPTAAGGWGEVAFRIAGALDNSQWAEVRRADDGTFVQALAPAGNGDYSFPIPPFGVGVTLAFTAYEDGALIDTSCRSELTITVPGFAAAVDPSLTEPTRWEPVGGVLPNPVLLAIEAVLLDATSAPRAGLHVEVELWRPAATAAFASLRATVRTASQHVDAAPYLRAELVAQQGYAGTVASPFTDAAACLAYSYRYRIVDSFGAEPWVVRAGLRYAVLAALPEAADTMAPYVADGMGQVASSFRSGEAVQFVGMPLEVSVLLPAPTGTPRWAELRYVDATGAAVEIRSLVLADTLPAGLLRIPLPNDPPLCATAVEVAVVDTDRAFIGTCGYVLTPPLPDPRGTRRGTSVRGGVCTSTPSLRA